MKKLTRRTNPNASSRLLNIETLENRIALSATPGDFSCDNGVDNTDLLIWQSGYGTTYDGSDFLTWQRNFGQPSGGDPTPDNVTVVLDTGFTLADGYTGDGAGGDDDLQFQEPDGSGNGIWLGQELAQVNAGGTGTVSSLGGPFDRNVWNQGANGGTTGASGTLATSDFAPGDQLRITFDYQFTLGTVVNGSTNVDLAKVGFRDGFGIVETQDYGTNAVPQQGWGSKYNQFGLGFAAEPDTGGSVKFFPDLNDVMGDVNADALIVSGFDVGLDPNQGDKTSADLQITYVASTDGAGNWTVDSYTVENLDTSTTFTYTGGSQTFTYFESWALATPGTPAKDAFYAQQLAPNGDTGHIGTTDAAKFELIEPILDVTTRVDTHFTTADGFAAGNLQFQNGWLGQASAQVDPTGTGLVNTNAAFERNLFNVGATGVTANNTDESGNGFQVGEQIHIEMEHQFTLDTSANRALFTTGFRPNFNTVVDALPTFEASPTVGMEAFYSNFDAATTGGSLKLFSDLARDGANGADNGFALFADGLDLGLDPENAVPDLDSDRLLFTYTVEYQGGNSWDTVELGVTNLETSFSTFASVDNTAALESFTYDETHEAFFASTWTRSAINTSIDRVAFQYLTPPPLSLFSYETDFTAAEGFVAGDLQFQQGWLGQTGQTVDPTGSGTSTSGGAFLRNLYNAGVTGSVAGSGTDGLGAGFNEGDVIEIEHDYQFTVPNIDPTTAKANVALNLTGFRQNFSTGGFDAAPTAGFKVAYSSFDPVNSGAIKVFSNLTRAGFNSADNAFALFANGNDLGLDVGASDFTSDNLRVTYSAKLTDAGTNTWTTTELTITNLDTSFSATAAVANPAALETFVYTGTDAYLASRWSDDASASVVTDRIKIEYLDPLPAGAGGLAAATSGTAGELLAAAQFATSAGTEAEEEPVVAATAALPVATASPVATLAAAGTSADETDALLPEDTDEEALDEVFAELGLALAS